MFGATDCLLVMGRRGCGKTYLSKNLQKLWPRRIVIDLLNEYGPKEGDIVVNFDQFTKKLIEFNNKKTLKFALIFKFDPESEISEIEFNEILRICYYFGNVQIVIEEIQAFSTPNKLPKWLKNCLLTGRHRNLSLLFTSQRPGMVNKTIVSQCAHVFCGNLIDGNDLKYVGNFLNKKADELIKLPDRQFIYFSKEGVREISNDL